MICYLSNCVPSVLLLHFLFTFLPMIYKQQEHTHIHTNFTHSTNQKNLLRASANLQSAPTNNTNMKLKTSFLLIFSLLLCLIFMSSIEPEYFYGVEYDVRVINGFKSNSSMPLVIWCHSLEKDLGGRALQEGEDFGWRLRTNLWGTSKFFCTMKWDQRRRSFDAFNIAKDGQRCSPLRKCSWLVREDGFYFSSDEINWKKDFSWFQYWKRTSFQFFLISLFQTKFIFSVGYFRNFDLYY